MHHLESVAAHTPPITKVMLTCFLSNKHAHSFYRKMGFERDAISPEPRKLRHGKTFEPNYVIMSKSVQRQPGTQSQTKPGQSEGENGCHAEDGNSAGGNVSKRQV